MVLLQVEGQTEEVTRLRFSTSLFNLSAEPLVQGSYQSNSQGTPKMIEAQQPPSGEMTVRAAHPSSQARDALASTQ